jgi:amidase
VEHEFEPSGYHNSFGSHEPVLVIASGDRVRTSTADAFGHGQDGTLVATRGNPLTGPFLIEGAEPGDVLVVRLESIVPNRDHGYTISSIAPHLVDADYSSELPERERVTWSVDVEAGVATLSDELASPRELEVGLRPMLGCIGVAPAGGQAISTATSGPYGGNMDYREVESGAVVMLPVFVPGALFFVGDGHAVQGEGEIVGTGIEISMDVEFSVELRKASEVMGTPRWPRMETATHLIALGNARPLDQALQHATTELVRWLCAEHGYDTRGASHLLGQACEYDIGNVFDPAYTVAAKISKAALEG